MQKVYACLVGNWVCLNDDPACTIGENGQSPSLWLKETPEMYAPYVRNPFTENTYNCLDYVRITYKNKSYRINPVFLQVVTEES